MSIPKLLLDQLTRSIINGKHRFALVPAGPMADAVGSHLRHLHTSTPINVRCWSLPDNALVSDRASVTQEFAEIPRWRPDCLVICNDAEKVDLLLALNMLTWSVFPEILLFGSEHQQKHQHTAENLERQSGITSHAVGYHFAKAHLWELLRHYRDTGRRGNIVELGVFQGGTTLLLAQMLKALQFMGNRIIGFDTWSGFPLRRHLLDMYAAEEFVERDFNRTATILRQENIELVQGDVVETIAVLRGEPLLLTFFDTDNYTPAKHALPVIAENTIVGGAIVFDHYFAMEEYNNAFGEGLAAAEFFSKHAGFLNLSGTGVFIKIP